MRETLEGLTAEMLFTQPSKILDQVPSDEFEKVINTMEHDNEMDVNVEKEKGEKRRREEEGVEGEKCGGNEKKVGIEVEVVEKKEEKQEGETEVQLSGKKREEKIEDKDGCASALNPPHSNLLPSHLLSPHPCPRAVSSLKRVAVSDIEIDTHVNHILNHTFPRSSFGSDLWREQRSE